MEIDIESLPYRTGVLGIVVDNDGKFLVVQMVQYKENEWRFPGGGVDAGEEADAGLLRELYEELGTDKFEILKKSQYVNQYDWTEEAIQRRFNKDGTRYRGQRQHQFLVRFTGAPEDVVPDPKELRQIRWATREELGELFVFPGQWEQVEKVLNELLPRD